MAVVKRVSITLEDGKINIEREGLSAEDMIQVIASMGFDVASNIEGVSVADIFYDCTATAIQFERAESDVHLNQQGLYLDAEQELDPQTDTEDATVVE